MVRPKMLVRSVAFGAMLLTASASAVSAQSATGIAHGHRNGNDPPEAVPLAATPELDSVLLFGSGLVGLAGYATMRLRARRK